VRPSCPGIGMRRQGRRTPAKSAAAAPIPP